MHKRKRGEREREGEREGGREGGREIEILLTLNMGYIIKQAIVMPIHTITVNSCMWSGPKPEK